MPGSTRSCYLSYSSEFCYLFSRRSVRFFQTCCTGDGGREDKQLSVNSCRLQGGNWKPSTGNRLRYDHGNVKRAACSLHQEEQGGTAPDLLENRPVIVKVPHRKAV